MSLRNRSSQEKSAIIKDFKNHVSSGKAETFKKYGMEIIMGDRMGIRFLDITGKKKLINCHSNGGVFNLGHKNPEIITALQNALQDWDIGNHHFISAQRSMLAKKIASLMPKELSYTVFGSGGGEAADLAIKLARGYTKRGKIISVLGGYHGHTGLSLAAGDLQYRAPFGGHLPGFEQVKFGDIQEIKKALSSDTAAIILETIPATLGICIPEKEYLLEIQRLCDKNGSLFILDEVQTGLGRTGKLWGFQNFGVVPDIVILGKGLSGGIYPISATVFRKELESFFHKNPFIHVSTFGGSELGCATAAKVLDISSKREFLTNVQESGEALKNGLENLKKKYPKHIKEIRGIGLMCGIVFSTEDMGTLFTRAAYDCGIFCLYSNNDKRVTQIMPPLITTETEVDEILGVLEKAIKRLDFYLKIYKVKKLIGRIF